MEIQKQSGKKSKYITRKLFFACEIEFPFQQILHSRLKDYQHVQHLFQQFSFF